MVSKDEVEMATAATATAAQAGKSSAPKRNNAARVFGYDVFISFALGPPPRGTHSYASDLARRLRERDFTVFFSEDEASPGEQLDSTLLKALHRSRTLVVIANRGTLQEPRWVRQEVEQFRSRHADRPIIPISIGGALQDATLAEQTRQWLKFDDKIWLDDSEDAVAQGIASDELVTRLAMAPAGRSSNVKWRWVVRAVVAGLVVLAGAATGFGIYAKKESRIAVAKAKEALDNADEANRQKAAAVKSEGEAKKQQGIAEENAVEAKRQQGIAEDETAKAVLQAKITNARRLATESLYRFGYSPNELAVSGALAIESLEAYPTTEGMKALSQVLRLIPTSPQIIPDAHQGQVGSLAFSRDGRWMASGGGRDAQVILWDLANQMKRRALKPLSRVGPPVWALDFSPDGRWLAAGSEQAVCIWDTASGEPVQEPIRHDYVVRSVAFSPDGQYLATSTYGEGPQRGARLFHRAPSQWEEVKPFLSGKGGFVSVIFGKNGDLAVADDSGVWMIKPSAPTAGNEYRFSDAGPCVALSLSPDASTLAALCQKGIAISAFNDKQYEFERDQVAISTNRTVDQLRMSASPGGKYVAVEGIIYSVHEANPQSMVLAVGDEPVHSIAFRPDGKVVAGGLENGSIAFWPTAQGIVALRVPGLTGITAGVSISPDEHLLATVSQDGVLRLFDISDPSRIHPVRQTRVAPDLDSVVFSPDSRHLAVAGKDHVLLLDVQTLGTVTEQNLSAATFVAFTRDSRVLLALDSSGVHRFDIAGRREALPIMAGKFRDFRLSPDGEYLSTWSQFNVGGQHHYIEATRVWRISSGVEVAWLEKGREITDGPSPEGPLGGPQRLVKDSASWPSQRDKGSKSADGIWSFDVNQYSSTLVLDEISAQRPIARLEHDGPVIDAAFGQRGRWLATSSQDGTVRLWPLQVDDILLQACKLLPRNLTSDEWKEFKMDGPYRKTCPTLP